MAQNISGVCEELALLQFEGSPRPVLQLDKLSYLIDVLTMCFADFDNLVELHEANCNLTLDRITSIVR